MVEALLGLLDVVFTKHLLLTIIILLQYALIRSQNLFKYWIIFEVGQEFVGKNDGKIDDESQNALQPPIVPVNVLLLTLFNFPFRNIFIDHLGQESCLLCWLATADKAGEDAEAE